MVIGMGKIGTLIALLLIGSKKYQVEIIDQQFSSNDWQRLNQRYPDVKKHTMDVSSESSLIKKLKEIKPHALISCLPYFLNQKIALIAKEANCGYFDLTEDVSTTKFIAKLAEGANSFFVPQCGLAPGMVGLIAHNLMMEFDAVSTIELRVGALPQFSNHGLKYALNWSTEGLINEYDNPCEIIKNGEIQTMPALESLESIEISGKQYEAFSTSGGLGSLVKLLDKKVQNLNYKTIRYPGHCEKIRFLFRDLNLQNNRELLKELLETSMPRTYEDIVVMVVNVEGSKYGRFESKQYIKHILPQNIEGFNWSAIQVSTATGLCAVLDVIMDEIQKYSGFVCQELLPFDKILQSPFGSCYA